jgi:murein L,D-transpeptidase YcbB/YkuD
MSDRSIGRVPPWQGGFAIEPAHEEHDLVADVTALARAPDVAAALAAADPPFESYQGLERALARQRHVARIAPRAPALPERTVHIGEPLDEADALHEWLVAVGDGRADDGAPREPGVYDAALAAAVARFQERHGVAPDGVIGPATRAALAVPLATRVRQIELALERFRWLPHRFARPPIAVNIPEFRLFALREQDGRYVRADDQLSMRVIVGKAWRHQTPVFESEIRTVVFWPWWEVPASIARGEMLPELQRDPGYLEQQQLELVDGWKAGAQVLAPSPENLEGLAAGALRLRQRPGPRNSLGLVKFLLPNPYHVYLHGTPARGLFARDARAFSHGCIRVEDPLALASWVLRDEPRWSRAAIAAALAGPETREVRVARPTPVYVLYLTAVPRPDGSVRFLPDVYGLDARLISLLEALPAGG